MYVYLEMRLTLYKAVYSAVIWLFQILQDRMLKLRIFPDEDHPFDTQPLDKFVMPPRKIREQRPRERRAAVRAQQGSSRESGTD